MPQVQPVNITVDALSVALTPVGGNGNGSMSYRSATRHRSAIITPKPGAQKDDPNRLTTRFTAYVLVENPEVPGEMIERKAFARTDYTIHPDIDADAFMAEVSEFNASSQVTVSASGETIY